MSNIRVLWMAWTVFTLFAALATVPGTAEQEANAVAEKGTQTRMTDAVRAWLADPACPVEMTDLAEADIRIMALGPGRHGWLALLVQRDQIAGHMIVSATPEGGLQLTACGLGDVPPDMP